MGRPYKITWRYQNDEEILDTSIYYYDPLGETLAPEDLTNLTAGVITRIAAQLPGIIADGVRSHSVIASSPAIGAVGPGRWVNAHGLTMTGAAEASTMDSIVANVTLRGENAAEETVVGGMKVSGCWASAVDNNQLDINFTDDLLSAWALIFPPTIGTGAGNLERCIKSVRPPADPEYVYPTTMTISSRVGVNLTRVGNRPQSNAGPITP